MPIRTLIVDDEFLARERLKKLLEPYPEIRLLGECRNGEEAIETVTNKEPDLLFLDVQMTGLNGIEVVGKLQNMSIDLPLIVFTTAYDQYALKAFEANAIDYLLKPFEKERFGQAIEKIKQQYDLRQSFDLNKKMMNLMKAFSPAASAFRLAFTIKEKGKEHIVPVEDIFCMVAEGNYLQLHTPQRDWLYRATMNQITEELDTSDFLRIHRSIILNLRYLQGYQYLGNNEYRFRMKNGKELVSSRSYKAAIMEYFSLND